MSISLENIELNKFYSSLMQDISAAQSTDDEGAISEQVFTQYAVDLLAAAGESVVPWLERFAGLRPQLKSALRFVRDLRPDWKEPTSKVLALLEGAPLLRAME